MINKTRSITYNSSFYREKILFPTNMKINIPEAKLHRFLSDNDIVFLFVDSDGQIIDVSINYMENIGYRVIKMKSSKFQRVFDFIIENYSKIKEVIDKNDSYRQS